MEGSELIVDCSRKVECRPPFLSVELSEVETAYQVTIEGSFFVFDESIMTVDLYHAMIMGDGERKDFPIQLLYTRRGSIQLNESIDRDATAVGVLPVCPVECLFPTFHLARPIRK